MVPKPKRFVLDVHLDTLSKTLRLFGFDTLYQNDITDNTIADIAAAEHRIVLIRDIGLLKHRSITWGRWLRLKQINEQVIKVMKQFQLIKN